MRVTSRCVTRGHTGTVRIRTVCHTICADYPDTTRIAAYAPDMRIAVGDTVAMDRQRHTIPHARNGTRGAAYGARQMSPGSRAREHTQINSRGTARYRRASRAANGKSAFARARARHTARRRRESARYAGHRGRGARATAAAANAARGMRAKSRARGTRWRRHGGMRDARGLRVRVARARAPNTARARRALRARLYTAFRGRMAVRHTGHGMERRQDSCARYRLARYGARAAFADDGLAVGRLFLARWSCLRYIWFLSAMLARTYAATEIARTAREHIRRDIRDSKYGTRGHDGRARGTAVAARAVIRAGRARADIARADNGFMAKYIYTFTGSYIHTSRTLQLYRHTVTSRYIREYTARGQIYHTGVYKCANTRIRVTYTLVHTHAEYTRTRSRLRDARTGPHAPRARVYTRGCVRLQDGQIRADRHARTGARIRVYGPRTSGHAHTHTHGHTRRQDARARDDSRSVAFTERSRGQEQDARRSRARGQRSYHTRTVTFGLTVRDTYGTRGQDGTRTRGDIRLRDRAVRACARVRTRARSPHTATDAVRWCGARCELPRTRARAYARLTHARARTHGYAPVACRARVRTVRYADMRTRLRAYMCAHTRTAQTGYALRTSAETRTDTRACRHTHTHGYTRVMPRYTRHTRATDTRYSRAIAVFTRTTCADGYTLTRTVPRADTRAVTRYIGGADALRRALPSHSAVLADIASLRSRQLRLSRK